MAKKYEFTLWLTGTQRWVVDAESLAEAERRLYELRDQGQRPAQDHLEREIMQVLEDGEQVAAPGQRRYRVKIELEDGEKEYVVFAAGKHEAVDAGVARLFEEAPDEDFLSVEVARDK
jgi:hypothetical protein